MCYRRILRRRSVLRQDPFMICCDYCTTKYWLNSEILLLDVDDAVTR